MRHIDNRLITKLGLSCGFVLTLLFAAMSLTHQNVVADDATDSAEMDQTHAVHPPNAMSLVDQLRELQQKVAKLEAALKQNHSGQGESTMNGMGMGKMGMAKGMQGMKMGMGMRGMGMGQMQGGSMQGMSDSNNSGTGMNMKGMGGMMPEKGKMGGGMMSMMGMQPGGMKTMTMTTALPGFPGASHLYHVGSTGFFLNHSDHITLTAKQQKSLNEIKQQALLEQDEADRNTEAAEQELWKLTSSDAPEIDEIEKAIRKIESLRGGQRIAFIRRVGEAAKILTDQQRSELVGAISKDHAKEE